MRRAIVVAFILSVALIPIVKATGGVIDSVQISGNGEIGEGPIDVNISLIGVGGASSSSVNWNVSLSDSDGNLIDYDSGNSLVDDGVLTYVETTLANAPLGISNLTVSLSGDVGVPNQNQWTNYSQTIFRLRPLDISIGEPIYNPIDSSGNDTGNLTLRDGDYARVEVPIINSGDVDWNGSVNLSIESENLPEQNVNVSGDSTVIVTFISNRLFEGMRNMSVSIDGPPDSDLSDNEYTGIIEVGPPPLPAIELSLQRLSEPAVGEQITWNLQANNSGDSTYSGQLVCSNDNGEFYSVAASIEPGNSSNFTVTMDSKPGEVTCSTDSTRTSATIDAVDIIEMTSAIFIGAGHSSPSLLGGPWHAGDDVVLSLLLRNEGDALGNARLVIEINGDTYTGTSVSLDSGKAGEVRNEFTIYASGQHTINWSIVSQDGVVDSNLSGSLLIPVLASQTIVLEIESVDVVEDGVEISWKADLADGKERLVFLEFGAIQDGLKTEGITEERLLLPGTTYGSVNIGFQNGQEVYADLSESGWTIGFGSFTSDEFTMPEFSVEPQVTVNPSTQPRVPSVGAQVTIFYTLNNLAEGTTPAGQIVITDSSGEILASDVSPEFSTGSLDSSSTVKWPSGDSVKVVVTWHIQGKSVNDEVMINSESVSETTEGFTIPWGGILGGLALGMVLIFAVRMKNSPAKESKPKETKTKKPVKGKEEKIEVACPSCDRRLRVPNTYTGAVRCPECETRFDVQAEQVEEEIEQQDSEVVKSEPENDALWSASKDDILGCPKCTRKLKVPYDKRPAKARCPACTTVFEARKE